MGIGQAPQEKVNRRRHAISVITIVEIWHNCALGKTGKSLKNMVGARGIEPLTSSVSRKRSPTELRAYEDYKITFLPSCLSTSIIDL